MERTEELSLYFIATNLLTEFMILPLEMKTIELNKVIIAREKSRTNVKKMLILYDT